MAYPMPNVDPVILAQQPQPQGYSAPVLSAAPGQGGMLSGVMPWLGSHSNALLQAGLALMAPPLQGGGWRGAAEGFATGTQMDQTAEQLRVAKEQRQKLQDALAGLAADQTPESPVAGLAAPIRNLMAADPGFASSILSAQLQPRMMYDRLNDNTVYNKITGDTQTVNPGEGGMLPFSGGGTDAQALNNLVRAKKITIEQANKFAAQKGIVGPNGEQIFWGPDGVVTSGTPSAAQGVTQGTGQQSSNGAPAGMTVVTGPKVSEDQMKARGFAIRAQQADAIISDPKVADSAQSYVKQGESQVPIFGNKLVGPDFQKSDQAERNFINAILRRESGAAINADEFLNANKQYWPQPGDYPETLVQKAAARKQAIQNLMDSGYPVPTFGGATPAQAPAQQNADPLGIR